jgi:IMP dehydrogenase
MKVAREVGLSFDDVLLVPKKNTFGSRKNVDVSTRLTKKVKLSIPIISANMDTVTGSQLSIALAESGGMGILHRFNTIAEEAAEVKRVKRRSSFILKDPYTIESTARVSNARALQMSKGVSGFPVLDGNKLVGIVTNRDIKFATDDTPIMEIMTKKKDLITVQAEENGKLTAEKFIDLFKQHKIEKIPIVDRHFNLTGLVLAKSVLELSQKGASKSKDGRLMVGAAVGVKDTIERSKALIEAGADVLVIDIAHGHSSAVIDATKALKKEFDIEVIAGNVATADAAEDLIAAGADAVKVGIGPGSVCTTRIVAGSGVPQLTAIQWTYEAAKAHNIPIIGDGGVRTSGDMAKALAGGASTVMIGKLFAGTEESPGATIMRGGMKYKFYRGMSSISANDKKLIVDQANFDVSDIVGEGNETFIPYIGSVKDLIYQLVGGLRSAMSYSGSTSISEFRQKAEFVRIGGGGARKESYDKLSE